MLRMTSVINNLSSHSILLPQFTGLPLFTVLLFTQMLRITSAINNLSSHFCFTSSFYWSFSLLTVLSLFTQMLRITSVINNISSHSILLHFTGLFLYSQFCHYSHRCSASLKLSIIYLLIRFYFLVLLVFSFVHSSVIIHTDASHDFSYQ